jgi:hypothetical protein
MTNHSPASIADSERQTIPALASGTAIVLYLALARMGLYLVAGTRYGYFRDELYYLACGQHPAWGYVDQPPLIGWVAWLLEHTIGTSLWALHLLPALAGAATIVLAGWLARALGGGRWAMFLAGLAVLLAPVSLALSHLFTMNAFDPLLWTAIACLVVRIVRFDQQPLWVAVGVLAGVTILNKYAVIFWILGIVAGLCLTPLRSSLRHRWFWLGCVLTTAIALPNLLWQWRHHFPFLELMHNIRQSGRDISLPPLAYLQAQAQMLGFVAALLVLGALLFAFSSAGRAFRALAWAYLIFLAEMLLLNGKMYYVAPVYPMMFAAGAVWLEAHTQRRAWAWAKPLLALGILAVGGVYAPTALPLLSVPHFLAYEHTLGIQQQKFEHTQPSILPQLYADMFGWEGIAQRVAAFYQTLSPQQQRITAIFANNYGDAGAIDFFGPKYGLPKAIGGHQNYWIWGPRGYTGESMIVLGEGNEANMRNKCASYEVVGNTKDPLSRPDDWLPIYYCRGFKGGLQAAWPKLKRWR